MLYPNANINVSSSKSEHAEGLCRGDSDARVVVLEEEEEEEEELQQQQQQQPQQMTRTLIRAAGAEEQWRNTELTDPIQGIKR